MIVVFALCALVILIPLVHILIYSLAALAGGVALGVMMIPTISRTTEEVVRVVPTNIREASLALGIPYWKTVARVVIPAARAGIGTAIVLAFARVAGETAPLLFT